MIGRALALPRARRQVRQDDGAAAVEFGLIAPVLVLLVFGIMSFGILFAQSLALSNAARQGARFGSVGSRTCADMVTETKNASTSININPTNVRVVVLRGASLASASTIMDTGTGITSLPCSDSAPNDTACKGSAPGDNVYVKASYQSKMLIPLFFTGGFTVGGTGAFKCEYQ